MSSNFKVSLNGEEYHVVTRGRGRPLLLLHGFTGSTASWSELSSMLASHYQVIMIDILGHGQSSASLRPERYHMKNVAADLMGLLDYLKIDQITLIGYSMGGRLALSTAFYFPERVHGLILESSSPGLALASERHDRIEHDSKLADFIEENGVRAFVDYWENIPLFATQKALSTEKQQALRLERLQQSALGLANSLRGMGTGSQPSWWEQLRKLSLPVSLIVGEDDLKFVKIAEQMAVSLRNAQIHVVEKSGHAIHVEQPQIFGKIVLNCLKEQETGSEFKGGC